MGKVKRTKNVAGLIFGVLFFCLAPPLGGLEIPMRYDRFFIKYTRKYFGPKFDWRYFKAQGVAESGLCPRSPDGAVGIMQLLPQTFEQIISENSEIRGNIREPKWDIAAGIYYDRKIWKIWDAERSFKDRLSFMFGAYNAGKKAILEAQQIALDKGLNARSWKAIKKTLHQVTGDESWETIAYVRKIH